MAIYSSEYLHHNVWDHFLIDVDIGYFKVLSTLHHSIMIFQYVLLNFPQETLLLKKKKKKSPNWDLPVDVIAYILEVPINLICKSVLWELNEVSSTTVEEHWMLILYSESSLYLWLYEL